MKNPLTPVTPVAPIAPWLGGKRNLAMVIRALKGRFILSLNDVQEVRETFAGFQFEEVKTTYTIAGKGAQPERAEVLIRNWTATS